MVDSRFHAKASETPTGRTEAAVTTLSSPNFFKVGQATVVSHTEPVEGDPTFRARIVPVAMRSGSRTITKPAHSAVPVAHARAR